MEYEQLPQLLKDNLTADQWVKARAALIDEGEPVPETTQYLDLKNGQIHLLEKGETTHGEILPAHDLSGGDGRDDSQFEDGR